MKLQNLGASLSKMRQAEKIDSIKTKLCELSVAKVNGLEKKRTIRLCIPVRINDLSMIQQKSRAPPLILELHYSACILTLRVRTVCV
jgi:hypothetical protein